MKISAVVGIASLVVLGACSQEENYSEISEEDYYEEEDVEEEYVPQPYDEYCFVSSENGEYDGECSVYADTNYYGDNLFARNIRISDNESLMEVGLDDFTITTFAGDNRPKFEIKTYTAVGGHFATELKELPEAIFPTDVNVMVPAKDASNFPGEFKPPYQLNSATLAISKVEHREFDEDEIRENKWVDGESGKQFVEGTMTINISKLGSEGRDISPLTITFRGDAVWRYLPLDDRPF